MKEIVSENLLNKFVSKYDLDQIFDKTVFSEMKLFQLDSGEILCRSGEILDRLFILVEGKFKISISLPNGKSLLLRFNNPLALIGDVEFINHSEVRSNVEAVNRSLVIGISNRILHETLSSNSAFLKFLLKNVSYKLYTFSNFSSINLLFPVENRFASYLVSTLLADDASSFANEIKTSKLTEIAELLGTSYRHLNRVVNKFSSENIIERKNGSLHVKDVKKLKSLAKGSIYE
ncbi:Crp/Fnr family transcriptional regulator [Bacillus sp. EAC]|uniref:Crp/Fnr family transcriptional regulator n=1 Tax=Bacillus sp. EAC TaxID=1978338 RepID=UPI000B433727|nr:cyclic nucleotide-binding domain-containing protein [Bacillus sp. EAC]